MFRLFTFCFFVSFPLLAIPYAEILQQVEDTEAFFSDDACGRGLLRAAGLDKVSALTWDRYEWIQSERAAVHERLSHLAENIRQSHRDKTITDTQAETLCNHLNYLIFRALDFTIVYDGPGHSGRMPITMLTPDEAVNYTYLFQSQVIAALVRRIWKQQSLDLSKSQSQAFKTVAHLAIAKELAWALSPPFEPERSVTDEEADLISQILAPLTNASPVMIDWACAVLSQDALAMDDKRRLLNQPPSLVRAVLRDPTWQPEVPHPYEHPAVLVLKRIPIVGRSLALQKQEEIGTPLYWALVNFAQRRLRP